MVKVTPDPPDTNPASPNENLNPPTPDFQPSIADIRASPRTMNTMFIVNPDFDIETLLGYACESLASAEVMANDLVDHLQGSSRNSLLGISQVIMLAELTVNRALDHLDPIEDAH